MEILKFEDADRTLTRCLECRREFAAGDLMMMFGHSELFQFAVCGSCMTEALAKTIESEICLDLEETDGQETEAER